MIRNKHLIFFWSRRGETVAHFLVSRGTHGSKSR